MSIDNSNNKQNPSASYPQGATKLAGEGAAGFSRVESWMTPERLKAEYLFGIPLVSPVTKDKMGDDTIKSIIRKVAANLETKLRIDIFPVQRIHQLPFDRTKYTQGWNQLDVNYTNVSSIQEVSIRASNSVSTPGNPTPPAGHEEGSVLYSVPLEWIDMSHAHKGLLHFVPLQTTFNSYAVVGPSAGAAAPLFAIFSQLQWIPSFWFVKATHGWAENSIPAPINHLIGCKAAMQILSLVGPLNRFNSQSISLDGSSQSVSGPGPQLYALRMQELEKEVADLEDLLGKRFGNKFFMTNF